MEIGIAAAVVVGVDVAVCEGLESSSIESLVESKLGVEVEFSTDVAPPNDSRPSVSPPIGLADRVKWEIVEKTLVLRSPS